MSLPLNDFTIERFRGLRGLKLEGLGRLNLLVGQNNSGKTSALEALSIFSSPLDPWVWMATASQRDPFAATTALVERLRWLFPQEPGMGPPALYEGAIHLAGVGGAPVREVAAYYHEQRGTGDEPARPGVSQSPGEWPEAEEVELRGARIDIELKLRQLDLFSGDRAQGSFTVWDHERFQSPRQRYEPAAPFQSIKPYDHWIRSLPVRGFSEAKLGGFEEAILALLKSIEPNITGVEVLVPPGPRRAEPMLYLRDARAGLLPLQAFGDGLRRALLLALAIPRASNGLLVIDELETAIHISALERVFRWLLDACTQYRVQVFATTHSLEALDTILAVDTTPEEDIVAYRIERDGERTTARRYGETLLKRIRHERGLDVR